MSFVLDASISLPWCFEDERMPAVMRPLDRVAEQGAVVPQPRSIEALAGLLGAGRRGRLAGFPHDLPIATADAALVGAARQGGVALP